MQLLLWYQWYNWVYSVFGDILLGDFFLHYIAFFGYDHKSKLSSEYVHGKLLRRLGVELENLTGGSMVLLHYLHMLGPYFCTVMQSVRVLSFLMLRSCTVSFVFELSCYLQYVKYVMYSSSLCLES